MTAPDGARVREEIAATRRQVADWRERAHLVCAADPAYWAAAFGVPLHTYLAKLDELDAVLVKAAATLTTEHPDD